MIAEDGAGCHRQKNLLHWHYCQHRRVSSAMFKIAFYLLPSAKSVEVSVGSHVRYDSRRVNMIVLNRRCSLRSDGIRSLIAFEAKRVGMGLKTALKALKEDYERYLSISYGCSRFRLV